MKTKYERVAEKVLNGTCATFENWHEFTGVSKEDFLRGVKWLYEEPIRFSSDKRLHNHDKLRREIGVNDDGTIVYLDRIYWRTGDLCGFYDTATRRRWSGHACLSADDRIWDSSTDYQLKRKGVYKKKLIEDILKKEQFTEEELEEYSIKKLEKIYYYNL